MPFLQSNDLIEKKIFSQNGSSGFLNRLTPEKPNFLNHNRSLDISSCEFQNFLPNTPIFPRLCLEGSYPSNLTHSSLISSFSSGQVELNLFTFNSFNLNPTISEKKLPFQLPTIVPVLPILPPAPYPFLHPCYGGGKGFQETRTLFIGHVNEDVTEETLRDLFEPFGDIIKIKLLKARHIAFIEFYDLRHAKEAKKKMNFKVLCGRKIEIQFSTPTYPKVTGNTGSLFVFAKQSRLKNETLPNETFKELFQKFGIVKKVTMLRNKPNVRFVEYYDYRHCQAARDALQKFEWNGMKLEAEFTKTPSMTALPGYKQAFGQNRSRWDKCFKIEVDLNKKKVEKNCENKEIEGKQKSKGTPRIEHIKRKGKDCSNEGSLTKKTKLVDYGPWK